MNLKKYLYLIPYAVLFFLGCARQTSPTGGPKDTIPPLLIKAYPENGQTNFKTKDIELLFNESVILNNPKEQIIITPDVGKEFTADVKKNKVILKIQNDLQDTTTYAVNFRESIQDITEKNPAVALKLAFSTGDYIDSLSIEGNIFNPLISKEIQDATVGLYQSDTFDIFKHRPVYFSKTDKKGNYSIGNLKPGTYYIYAIDDRNKNLIADSKSEAFGFLKEPILLKTNTKNKDIPLIHLDSRPLKLTSARSVGTYFNIKTTKNVTSYSTKSEIGQPLFTTYGEDQANIRIYNTIQDYDSIPVLFHGLDSINNSIDTTLYVKFTRREIKPEQFKISLSTFEVIGTKGMIKGEVFYTKPLLKINYDSIFYRIDSTKIIPITNQDITIDTLTNTLSIKKTFDKLLLVKNPEISNQPIDPTKTKKETKLQSLKKEPKQPDNQLYIAAGSFISVERDSSNAVTQTVTPTTLESTGVLLIQVQTQAEHFIVQVLSKDHKKIISVANNPKLAIEDLTPGEYQIRLIIDTDDNGAWSPGNFYTRQEPEKIIFYKNEKDQININLKANWEIGPLLIKH
jgi:uncharacterized protein (DUF2141 family)